MIILYFLIIPIIYLPVKLLLYFLVSKFGKFSYDGFSSLGFAYNSKKNIFYTVKNAWQRNFGYCYLYDVGAPFFNMIIDTETIRFYYNGKNYLISFWKGQYGIVTGAEVGIYYTNELVVNKKTLYLPLKDKDLLNISFRLYKNGEKIEEVSEKHWWLAIFKLGMFSNPKELTMDISITFPDEEMLEAFLKSFKKLGYKNKDYEVTNTTFKFIYKKPKTHKVWTRGFISDSIRQFYNKKNAIIYNNYFADLIDYDNDSPKVNKINDYIPIILKNSEESDDKFNNIVINDKVFNTRNKS